MSVVARSAGFGKLAKWRAREFGGNGQGEIRTVEVLKRENLVSRDINNRPIAC
jgi:hypothetical protein